MLEYVMLDMFGCVEKIEIDKDNMIIINGVG